MGLLVMSVKLILPHFRVLSPACRDSSGSWIPLHRRAGVWSIQKQRGNQAEAGKTIRRKRNLEKCIKESKVQVCFYQ